MVGEDAIAGPAGARVACWIVEFREKPGDPPVRFWIAKAGQVLLREEAAQADGLLVKSLLDPEAGDLQLAADNG